MFYSGILTGAMTNLSRAPKAAVICKRQSRDIIVLIDPHLL